MSLRVSVVVPVYNAAGTLTDCLRGLAAQNQAASSYEIIVVDDGSNDGTADVARNFGVRLIQQANRGAPAARNVGLAAATGDWVAFIDADCIPSRGWLSALLQAIDAKSARVVLGAAGRTIGHASTTPAARFVDLSGGLDAEYHLAHPLFPFAPSGNLLYRRDRLLAVGGFDERFATYDACDLHTRLRADGGGEMLFVPQAVVLHHHRSGWRAFLRQQRGYGYGYGQFVLKHRAAVNWTLGRDLGQWVKLALLGLRAAFSGKGDAGLVSRGNFLKALAQRRGFCACYWNRHERRRWKSPFPLPAQSSMGRLVWRGLARPGDAWLAVRIGCFIWTVPHQLDQSDLPGLLAKLARRRRPRAADPRQGVERIARLRAVWLHRWPFQARNTCYVRALTAFRFLDASERRVRIHFGVEPGADSERHRGHAWITVEGQVFESPDAVTAGRIREIFAYPHPDRGA